MCKCSLEARAQPGSHLRRVSSPKRAAEAMSLCIFGNIADSIAGIEIVATDGSVPHTVFTRLAADIISVRRVTSSYISDALDELALAYPVVSRAHAQFAFDGPAVCASFAALVLQDAY